MFFFIEKVIFKDVPDEIILKNLSEKLAMKWKPLGRQLGVPEDRLRILSELPSEDAYGNVLDAWKDTQNKPYIWDTFLNALRSSEVYEMETADIICT